MKSTILAVCLVSLLVVSAGVAGAISLTDYKFPESTSQEAYVNGGFNAEGNSIDSTEVGYSLSGAANYRLNYRSLPFSYDLTAAGGFSVVKGTAEDSETVEAYNATANTVADRYLSEDSEVFGYGGASLEYRKLATENDADDPRIDIEVGLGYGRTINATVLKQAIRMNQDFLRYNVITGDLPDNALLALASVIDREGEFRSRYGAVEYRKYWYEEMERVVKEAGVLSGEGLGAIGVLRIGEVLAEPTAQRWHGWALRGGVGYRVSDFDGESGDPILSARFDWHRPIGVELQLTNQAAFRTVLEDDPVYSFNELFRVDYEITNRIDWLNSAEIHYDIPTVTGAENILHATLRSAYIFYIENKLSFVPDVQFIYHDDGINDAEWEWRLRAPVTYRLR